MGVSHGGLLEATLSLPSPAAFARSLAGYALLGGVAILGSRAGASASPVLLLPAVGCLLLTVPALLVAHSFLGLRAGPGALLTAIARPFSRVGEVALGLVPALLLFRATSGALAETVLLGMGLTLAILGFTLAIRHVIAAETATTPGLGGVLKMYGLTWAWAALAALIGARLAAGVLLGV